MARTAVVGVLLTLLLTSCATQQGYHGANIGALTGAPAGILLDPNNRWRGAVIGGSLGATFGGALTDQAYYTTYSPNYQQYTPSCSSPLNYYNQQYVYRSQYRQYQPYAVRNNRLGRGAAYGGLAGATAGALIDGDNRWRGGLIGGALEVFFGRGINFIKSTPGVPVLQP